MRRITVAAQHGDGDALGLLGNLYRMGKTIPGALLEREPDKAERYLSNAAAKGRLWAVPGLAELELSLGKADSAAVWALVCAHYTKARAERTAQPGSRASNYCGYLLDEALRVAGAAYGRELATEDAAALIERYGAAFENEMKVGDFAAMNSGAHCGVPKIVNTAPLTEVGRLVSPNDVGRLAAVMVVEENGKVRGSYVFDAAPDRVASVRSHLASSLRYEAVPSGSGLRIAHYSLEAWEH